MTCGVDLIRVTFKESLSGFDNFLKHNGSSISAESDLGGYNKEITFNFNGIGFVATVSKGKKTISIVVGALREYKHASRSERQWKFLQALYKQYPYLKITGLDFATDLPYWFSDLKITPKKYTRSSEKSSIYFDLQRPALKIEADKKSKVRDDIVIYDKSWKCGLVLPLSRIELRIKSSHLNDIGHSLILGEEAQRKLLRFIDKKLKPLRVKKGAGTIRHSDCDRERSIILAMQYLQGDDSLLPLLLKHRTDEVIESSKLWNRFITIYCQLTNPRKNLMGHKDVRALVNGLSAEKKSLFYGMLKNFKYYDKTKWCKNSNTYLGRRKLLDKDRRKVVEMNTQGITMRDIGDVFDVSESTISRILKKLRIRKERVRLRPSNFMLM